jgi:hypothetical protein
MSSFNRSQILGLIIVLIHLLNMASSTSKTCWPELIGKTADEAVQVIKEESGRHSLDDR